MKIRSASYKDIDQLLILMHELGYPATKDTIIGNLSEYNALLIFMMGNVEVSCGPDECQVCTAFYDEPAICTPSAPLFCYIFYFNITIMTPDKIDKIMIPGKANLRLNLKNFALKVWLLLNHSLKLE